jgi:hypothetical protein
MTQAAERLAHQPRRPIDQNSIQVRLDAKNRSDPADAKRRRAACACSAARSVEVIRYACGYTRSSNSRVGANASILARVIGSNEI